MCACGCWIAISARQERQELGRADLAPNGTGLDDIKKDVDTLNRILAEDWIGIDFEGTILNKAQALQGIASGSGSLQSTVLRDIKVRVYGNTAIVTGSDTEKGQFHGRDSSGRYLWTDVFVHRNGRWQAVSSQSTKLTAPEGPKLFARLHEIRLR